MSRIKDRTGEFGVSNSGERMTIIRYGGRNDIDVQFVKDGVIVEHKQYGNFLKGNVKNPMTPSVYGVGFIGIGDFKSKDENGKTTKCYEKWHSMHQRCYDSKLHKKQPTYENCTVCQLWNNYQEFAKWDNDNYYEVGNERMVLDKDILCKGNKVYSPENCVYVPQFINTLFVKSDKIRGDYYIGVTKNGNNFEARLNKDNETIHLGTYPTPEEAFLVYKQAKEDYIKEVAEEYKDKIDPRAYEALMNYEVDIND